MTRLIRVHNASRNTLLGSEVTVANRWWSRLRGLLGSPPLQPGEGLILTPCRAVHMLGMRWPLDVLFVDADQRIVATYPGLQPRGRTAWHAEARHALELPAGTLQQSGTQVGDTVRWIPVG